MTIETNKRLVEEFFSAIANRDLATAFAMIHDDVAWWSAGGENLASSGTLNKAAFMQSIEGMGAIFAGPMELTPVSMVAEGDRVAVELVGHAPLKDGRNYDNLYHLQITFKDGQIIAVREYHDTLYAKIVLIEGKSSNSPT